MKLNCNHSCVALIFWVIALFQTEICQELFLIYRLPFSLIIFALQEPCNFMMFNLSIVDFTSLDIYYPVRKWSLAESSMQFIAIPTYSSISSKVPIFILSSFILQDVTFVKGDNMVYFHSPIYEHSDRGAQSDEIDSCIS